MSVDRPLSRPLVVVKNAAQPLLYPLARPLVRSALYSTSALTRFGVNGVEAALALDFIGSEYRTGNTATTFADAFMGTSPKLTYSASSNSTMVNSAGEIVWAPHNLHRRSSDISSWSSKAGVTASSSGGNELGDIPTTLFTATSGSAQHRAFDAQLSEANPVTFSFYVKPGTFDYVQFHDGVTANYWADFDLTGNGSVIRHTGFDATPTIEAVTSAGQTFFKVTVQYTSVLTTILPIISFPDPSTVVSSGTRNPTWTAAGTETLYIGGIHLYRSDLGGMHPVPGAATGFEYYVPTNGNPEYLPRVGHHVYNGSAWVNEGLLIESEARTNLVTHSEDFTDASWFKEGLLGVPSAVYNSLTGVTNAYELTENSATSTQHRAFQSITISSGAEYTVSVYVKRGVGSRQFALLNVNAGSRVYFDLNSGTVGDETNGTGKIVDVGGGWFHCSATGTSTNTSTALYLALCDGTTTGSETYNGDGTSSILIYGAQLEQGQVVNGTPVDAPTPSSYIPTNGSTVTRGGQSLTVPPAQFGWPEPEYIGPNLVDNDKFTSDLTLWTEEGTSGVVTWDASGAALIGDGNGVTNTLFTQTVDTVVGAVYELSVDVSGTGTGVRIGVDSDYGDGTYYSSGTVVYRWVANSVSEEVTIFRFRNHVGQTLIDNISVKEINPLSVSLQMDGRMTYADDDVGASATFVTAGSFVTGTTYVIETVGTTNFTAIGAEANTVGTVFTATGAGSGDGTALPMTAQLAKWGGVGMALDTHDTATGGFVFTTDDGNTEYVETSDTALTPGILTPFNISSRHGSTFVNGAVDGVALTANTTPTALPDLSGTDLEIAKDFMGTIGTFRQFAGDIGDDGLVTATNPSTEPTLSLTFDGTEGSFYNLNWSE